MLLRGEVLQVLYSIRFYSLAQRQRETWDPAQLANTRPTRAVICSKRVAGRCSQQTRWHWISATWLASWVGVDPGPGSVGMLRRISDWLYAYQVHNSIGTGEASKNRF